MSAFRTHSNLILAAGFGALAAAVIVLVRRSSIRKYIDDPAHVGGFVSTPIATKTKAQEDTPAYDIVIIGGGTAGCALASRLSENLKVSVLLLEAGGSGATYVETRIPAAFSNLFGHRTVDYNLFTLPQHHSNLAPVHWPQAKLLGGCTNINAMIFHTCAPGDFDEWSKADERASHFAWSNFKKYFLKFENYSPHPKHSGVDTSKHGAGGPISTGYYGYHSEASKAFEAGCQAVGIEKNDDVNGGNTLGVTKLMTYIDKNKTRSTAETGYLTPQVLSRPNLTIALHAQVTRILFKTEGHVTRAVGVEFAKTRDGPRYQVSARAEVLICGGAVHTPHILKLSGVGPAEELNKFSIPVVKDIPGVGAGLVDHPVVYGTFRTRQRRDYNDLMRVNFTRIKAMAQYTFLKDGPLTSNVAESAAFFRSSDSKLFPPHLYKPIPDPSSGPDSPDLELLAGPFSFASDGKAMVLGMGIVLLRPTSRGSIKLQSPDPFDQPLIDPNYLATRGDAEVLTRGYKLLLRVANTDVYKDWWVPGELDKPFLETKTDEELEKIVRSRCTTLYHPMGSARIAPLENGGVLDSTFKVHGIPNLRVIDASAFPTPLSGHTSAPVYAIAEAAAEFISTDLAARK